MSMVVILRLGSDMEVGQTEESYSSSVNVPRLKVVEQCHMTYIACCVSDLGMSKVLSTTKEV